MCVRVRARVCVYVYVCVGCKFKGDRSKIGSHKLTCSFKDESQMLAVVMKEVRFNVDVSLI